MIGDIGDLVKLLLFWALIGVASTLVWLVCLLVWLGHHVRFA